MLYASNLTSPQRNARKARFFNGGTEMKGTTGAVMAALFLFVLAAPGLIRAQTAKTYKHASEYQVAVLDQTVNVATGADITRASTQTDAKLNGGGQNFHMLYNQQGNYRIEAPVNKGASILAALAVGANAPTVHNKWFLDDVRPGTKVLFAAHCAKPSRKHPNQTVRCTFWLPDPDSATHEYETIGDFTPYVAGDGSNTQNTANALCGTGKLKPETEAQICGHQ